MALRDILKIVREVKKKYSPYYESLITIHIYRDNLLHNINVFQAHYPNVQYAPVLKSNAYGHGLITVANILKDIDAPFLVIDSHYEALLLRNNGIDKPVLVIGYTFPDVITKSIVKNIAFAITSLDHLKRVTEQARSPVDLHIKIDTGMHRQGIMPQEISDVVSLSRKNKYLNIVGACSHFADANMPNSVLTAQQISTWNECATAMRSKFPGIKYFHLAATAGSFYSDAIDANVMRIGIGTYGIDGVGMKTLGLKPILDMRSIISSIRELDPHEPIGYNAIARTVRRSKIATVPAGYSEGVDRRLSNIGAMLVDGEPCRIIGRVSMNITSIDVTDIAGIKNNDEVIIYSADRNAPNSIFKTAQICNTVPHEILAGIAPYLRRKIS